MPHGEFLRLLQLVDVNRKATDRDSMEIQNIDVETAVEIDNRAASHQEATKEIGCAGIDCPECRSIRADDAMLWEKLHAQGQDFPMQVWDDATGHNFAGSR